MKNIKLFLLFSFALLISSCAYLSSNSFPLGDIIHKWFAEQQSTAYLVAIVATFVFFLAGILMFLFKKKEWNLITGFLIILMFLLAVAIISVGFMTLNYYAMSFVVMCALTGFMLGSICASALAKNME